MKRILVPTDFSRQAENALKVAVQVAKKYDSEIILMHMLELPMDLIAGKSRGQDLPEALFFMRMARKRFEKLLKRDYLKDVKVTDTVEFHEAFNGIIDGVEEHDCDLIIMGSHGASGMEEVFIGSNTEKVVRHSNIPVLVIKEEIPDFKVDNFIFATDFVPEGQKSFLEALKLADQLGIDLHLVYINTSNKFKTTPQIEEKMKKFTQGAPTQNFTLTVYNDKSIEQGILDFSMRMDADLMGIGTHGRKGLAHLLNGSISEDLVNHARKPVITFKV